MRNILNSAFLAIVLTYSALAQQKDEFWLVAVPVQNIAPFKLPSDCQTNNANLTAAPNTLVKIISVTSDRVAFQLIRAYTASPRNPRPATKSKPVDPADAALYTGTYCIDKATFDLAFKPSKTIDTGILAVPFKLRADPLKIFPGGTLGGFVGRRYEGRKSASVTTLLGFAGLTLLSLNDVNAETPETKFGVSGGGGIVWKVTPGFQVGAVTGIDLFDGVSKWVYKYQPWLTLSVGFTFTQSGTNPDPPTNLIQRE